MRKLLIFLALSLPAGAAQLNVKTSPGAGEYPYTQTGLQNATNAAVCGDTVAIEAGVITMSGHWTIGSKLCTLGSQITFKTLTSAASLPPDGEQITPAYLALIPILNWTSTAADGQPFVDVTALGVSYITFQDIGVKLSTTTQPNDYTIFGIGYPYATTNADRAHNITAKRIYLTTDFDKAKRFTNAFQVYGDNITVKDSWMEGIQKAPKYAFEEESYAVFIGPDSLGPITVTNNSLVSGFSIPVFTGGNYGIKITNQLTQNVTVNDNTIIFPDRYAYGSPNFVGNAFVPCQKNAIEEKEVNGVTIKRNWIENFYNGCGSQGNAFTFTARSGSAQTGGAGPGYFGTAAMTTSTTVTLTGYGRNDTNYPDPAIGMRFGFQNTVGCPTSTGYGNYVWSTITNVAGSVITVSPAYPSVPVSTGACFAVNPSPWITVQHGDIENNAIFNVGKGILVLGLDETEQSTRMDDLVVKNNLIYNNSPYMVNGGSTLNVFTTELAYLKGTNNAQIKNNTYSSGPLLPTPTVGNSNVCVQEEKVTPASLLISQAVNFSSNLCEAGYYAFIFSSGVTPDNFWTTRFDSSLTASTNLYTNATNGIDWAGMFGQHCTGGQTCSGNTFLTQPGNTAIYPLLTDPVNNDFSVKAPYAALGADTTLIPLIQYPAVTTTSTQMLIDWRLTTANSTNACSMAISTSSAVKEFDGAYSVVNQLDPVSHARYNLDTVHPGVTGSGTSHRTWTVTGLTAGTTYYLTLRCGAAMYRTSFNTAAPAVPNTLRGARPVRGGTLR